MTDICGLQLREANHYVRKVCPMATAMGTNTNSGIQAASVGRNKLKPPSDWQASVTTEKEIPASRQIPIDKKMLRCRLENINGRPSINIVASMNGWRMRECTATRRSAPGSVLG